MSRNWPAAVLVALLAAGCGGTTEGAPSVAPSNGASTSTKPASPSSELPPRPREIKLDGLDPCQLWTPDQLGQLLVTTTPVAGGPQENAAGYPVCTYRTSFQSDLDLGFSATTVLDLDATIWLGDSAHVEVTVVDVDGFPAVREAGDPKNGSPCKLAISTSSGQHLQVRAETRPGEYSVDQACDITTKAAKFAMQTLQTLR